MVLSLSNPKMTEIENSSKNAEHQPASYREGKTIKCFNVIWQKRLWQIFGDSLHPDDNQSLLSVLVLRSFFFFFVLTPFFLVDESPNDQQLTVQCSSVMNAPPGLTTITTGVSDVPCTTIALLLQTLSWTVTTNWPVRSKCVRNMCKRHFLKD